MGVTKTKSLEGGGAATCAQLGSGAEFFQLLFDLLLDLLVSLTVFFLLLYDDSNLLLQFLGSL